MRKQRIEILAANGREPQITPSEGITGKEPELPGLRPQTKLYEPEEMEEAQRRTRYSGDELHELLESYANHLKKPGNALWGGSYRFKPTDDSLQNWEASDGSQFSKSLMGVILHHTGGNDADMLSVDPHDAEQYIVPMTGQEDHELDY